MAAQAQRFRFWVRAPSGKQHLLELDGGSTVSQLQGKLQDLTGIARTRQKIKFGYPPSELQATSVDSLKSLGIRSGSTLIVQEVEESAASVKTKKKEDDGKSSSESSAPKNGERKEDPCNSGTGLCKLEKVVVPDDNSCLFTAVGYACESEASLAYATTLRQVCASLVLSSGYSSAMLGKPPEAYAKEILDPRKWGGGIELAMLSKYYQMEICAIDVQTLNPYTYSQEKGFKKRVYLLYNGIHYDVIVSRHNGKTVRQFPPGDTKALDAAVALARTAKGKKQFVNTATFSLVCTDCDTRLKGAKDAQQHAEKTGHRNFQQI